MESLGNYFTMFCLTLNVVLMPQWSLVFCADRIEGVKTASVYLHYCYSNCGVENITLLFDLTFKGFSRLGLLSILAHMEFKIKLACALLVELTRQNTCA